MIQRYDLCNCDDSETHMDFDDNGDYVKYTDHLEDKDKEIAALQARLDKYEDVVTAAIEYANAPVDIDDIIDPETIAAESNLLDAVIALEQVKSSK